MKIFVLSKNDKNSEALLGRYAFKIAPKVFIAFSMSARIEDYIVSECEKILGEASSMIVIKKSNENQAIIRTVGKSKIARELDGIVLFE